MKKIVAVLLACLSLSFAVQAADRDAIDLVVLLDTSSSMFPARQDISDYLIGPLLTEFLKIGDTFHLLQFAGSTKMELSRKIEGAEDVQTIIARLLLMYPLDPHTDFIGALSSVYEYVRDLPDNREKTVVVVSDGEHAPPPGSPNAGIDTSETAKRIEAASAKLKGNGWNFYFVKVPFSGAAPLPKLSSGDTAAAKASSAYDSGTGKAPRTEPAPSSGAGSRSSGTAVPAAGGSAIATTGAAEVAAADTGPGQAPAQETETPGQASEKTSGALDVTDAVSEALASPVVEWSAADGAKDISAAVGVVFVEYPPQLGKKTRKFTVPVKVRNPSTAAMYLETVSVLVDGIDRMVKPSFLTLKPRSEATLPLKIGLAEDMPLGEAVLEIAPVFAGKLRPAPDRASIALTLVDAPLTRFLASALPYLLFGAGLLLAVLALIALIHFSRKSFGAPSRVASGAASAGRASIGASASPAGGAASAARQPAVRQEPVRPADERKSEISSRPGLLKKAESRSETKAPDAILPQPSAPAKTAASEEAARSTPSVQQTTHARSSKAPSDFQLTFPGVASAATREAGTQARAGLHPSVLRLKKAKAARDELIPVERAYSVKKENARIQLSLWVRDQNRAIGRRNVHIMKAGATLSLGGGRSDFTIFLVPLPHRIADIRFDGENCVVVPRRPAYFPDNGAAPIENCIGKTVRLVSDKGYELFFRIDKFEDPLAKLNKFLHTIDAEGLPGR